MSETHIPAPIPNDDDEEGHPFEVFERVFEALKVSLARNGDDEMGFNAQGTLEVYGGSIQWLSNEELLHISCGFELVAGGQTLFQVRELVRLINQRLYLGHFDYFESENLLVYRGGLVIAGSFVTECQAEAFWHNAVDSCDIYRLAFKAVMGGSSAIEAMERVVSENAGHA